MIVSCAVLLAADVLFFGGSTQIGPGFTTGTLLLWLLCGRLLRGQSKAMMRWHINALFALALFSLLLFFGFAVLVGMNPELVLRMTTFKVGLFLAYIVVYLSLHDEPPRRRRKLAEVRVSERRNS